MKKSILNHIFLGSVCMMALPVIAGQFIDCSDGNAACDVLYATDESFIASPTGIVETNAWALQKTNDKPLAESQRMQVLPADQQGGYRIVLPEGATQTSSPNNPLPGTVVVPNRQTDSRVDVLPDGSVRTTTMEITTKSLPDGAGYTQTNRRTERLDTEKKGAVWVEKSLADKVDYGDAVHDWEAPQGETLRSLLMQWGEVSGWTVVWKLDKDYRLEAGVVFRGTFTEVASAIIRTFARALPAPIGTFYKGNRVLVVSVQEDENAH